jgi:hypothetical protein
MDVALREDENWVRSCFPTHRAIKLLDGWGTHFSFGFLNFHGRNVLKKACSALISELLLLERQ